MGKNEEQQFLELLAEKRHKELIGALAKLSTSITVQRPSEEMELIVKSIAENKASNDLPKGAVAISKLIIENLNGIKDTIRKETTRLIDSRAREWEFRISVDNLTGVINLVKAKMIR